LIEAAAASVIAAVFVNGFFVSLQAGIMSPVMIYSIEAMDSCFYHSHQSVDSYALSGGLMATLENHLDGLVEYPTGSEWPSADDSSINLDSNSISLSAFLMKNIFY
jgi:hypothetical protein